VTFQSSVTTFGQGKDQLEEQDEVTSPIFYDLRTLFQEEESLVVVSQSQMIEDDQAANIPVLVTSTPSLKEQMQELQRKLAEKEAKIANLTARLENGEREKINEASGSETAVTPQDIKELIAQGIKEYQAAVSSPVPGHRNPYPTHYDLVPFPKSYQKPNFEKFDGINGSPHEQLAHFYSACGEITLNDALLIRQFV